MANDPLYQTRILNEKVRATLRRLEEAEARTRELQEDIECLIEKQQLLLQPPQEPDIEHDAVPLPMPAPRHAPPANSTPDNRLDKKHLGRKRLHAALWFCIAASSLSLFSLDLVSLDLFSVNYLSDTS